MPSGADPDRDTRPTPDPHGTEGDARSPDAFDGRPETQELRL
jgi:hypothetical protein